MTPLARDSSQNNTKNKASGTPSAFLNTGWKWQYLNPFFENLVDSGASVKADCQIHLNDFNIYTNSLSVNRLWHCFCKIFLPKKRNFGSVKSHLSKKWLLLAVFCLYLWRHSLEFALIRTAEKRPKFHRLGIRPITHTVWCGSFVPVRR